MMTESRSDVLEAMLGLPAPYVVDRIDLDEVELFVRLHVRYGSPRLRG